MQNNFCDQRRVVMIGVRETMHRAPNHWGARKVPEMWKLLILIDFLLPNRFMFKHGPPKLFSSSCAI